jgi:general stress protein CsbA
MEFMVPSIAWRLGLNKRVAIHLAVVLMQDYLLGKENRFGVSGVDVISLLHAVD